MGHDERSYVIANEVPWGVEAMNVAGAIFEYTQAKNFPQTNRKH